MFGAAKKLVKKSVYNPKKNVFLVEFKDASTAKLVRVLLGAPKSMTKTVTIKVDANTPSVDLLRLLELTS